MADKVNVYRVSKQGTFDRRVTEIDGRFPGLYILPPREKSFLNNGGEQGRAYDAGLNALVDLSNGARCDTWEDVEEFLPDYSRRRQVRRWGCVVSDYSMSPMSVEEGVERARSASVAMSQATQLGLLQSLAESQRQSKDNGWQPMVMRLMALTIVFWVIIWGILLLQEQGIRDGVNRFGEQYQIFDNPIQGLTGQPSEPAPAPTAAPGGEVSAVPSDADTAPAPSPTPDAGPRMLGGKEDAASGSAEPPPTPNDNEDGANE